MKNCWPGKTPSDVVIDSSGSHLLESQCCHVQCFLCKLRFVGVTVRGREKETIWSCAIKPIHAIWTLQRSIQKLKKEQQGNQPHQWHFSTHQHRSFVACLLKWDAEEAQGWSQRLWEILVQSWSHHSLHQNVLTAVWRQSRWLYEQTLLQSCFVPPFLQMNCYNHTQEACETCIDVFVYRCKNEL